MEIVEAVILGDLEAVKSLLDKGADINAKKQGSSLVSLAVKNRHSKVCEYLLYRGAPIGGVVDGHAVILNIASFNYDYEVLKVLLENDLPYNFEKLLKEVTKNCDFKALKLLVEKYSVGHPVANTLPELVKKNKDKELSYLIEHYYKPSDVESLSDGLIKLSLESVASDCTNILLENGVSFGDEALIKCIELGDGESLKLLLQSKQKNHDLNLALRTAVEFGHQSICEQLLEYGADINTRNYGDQSLVFIAKEHNQKAMLQYLLSKGLVDDTDQLTKIPKEEKSKNIKMTHSLAELIKVDPTILQKHLIFPLKDPVEFTPKVPINEQHLQILKICDGFHLFDEHNQIGFFLWGSEDFSYEWFAELTEDCLKEGICPLAGFIPHNVSVRLSDGAVVATDWEDYNDKEYFGRLIEVDVFKYIRTIIELWEKYDATAEDGDDEHSSWWSSYANYGDREDLE